jgi:hypothetical protein
MEMRREKMESEEEEKGGRVSGGHGGKVKIWRRVKNSFTIL